MAEKLQPLFDKPLRYLDIGTGPSIFPSWVASKTQWDVTCLDKFDWVKKQNEYAKKLGLDPKRFHVVVRDFLEAELEPESFDVITNISVIEHFEGALDSVAMEKSARLLKPGGMYLLTTPLNEGYARDWFLQQDVYGEKFTTEPVFFQRHYDVASFNRRIVQASELTERERVYFGDYEEPFFNDRIVDKSGLDKIKRTLLQMNTVKHALLHGSYRNTPVSMSGMKIYTSAGVCVVLTKPERS